MARNPQGTPHSQLGLEPLNESWPGEQKKSHAGSLQVFSRIRPAWLNGERNRYLPLFTARVAVLMMPVGVGMLMSMHLGPVLVLLPVMAMGAAFMAMFVLMLVLVVATHLDFTSFI
jgi:hypothetical protein